MANAARLREPAAVNASVGPVGPSFRIRGSIMLSLLPPSDSSTADRGRLFGLERIDLAGDEMGDDG